MHAFGSTETSSLAAIDRLRWEIHIKDFLKRNGDGLSFIKCYVIDACVMCLPLRECGPEDIRQVATQLRALVRENVVARWEVVTIFPD